MDSIQNKRYTIMLPNGGKKKLYYNSKNYYVERLKLLNDYVLKHWEEYSLSHWISFEHNNFNYEDRLKLFLDRCGSFLLLGELDYNGILTTNKQKNVYKSELPVSCTNDIIQDEFYSITEHEDDYCGESSRKNLMLDNEIIMGNIDPDYKVKIHKSRLSKITKRYTNSQHYKINKIYSKPEIVKKELYKLKNKDLADKPLNKELTEKELKQWQEKSFRNIHGENVYEYRNKVYPSRQGLIDSKYPYKWTWGYVWADNTFEFEAQKYKIDDSVVQYKVDADNQSGMDKILCYSQIINGKEKYFFFDQNINKVDNKCIIKL